MNGSIVFDGVRFEYPGRPEPVADLSLRVAAGELVVCLLYTSDAADD